MRRPSARRLGEDLQAPPPTTRRPLPGRIPSGWRSRLARRARPLTAWFSARPHFIAASRANRRGSARRRTALQSSSSRGSGWCRSRAISGAGTGLHAAPKRPPPAARRLSEKNRLDDLEIEAQGGPRNLLCCADLNRKPRRRAVAAAARSRPARPSVDRALTQKTLAEARDTANAAERRQASLVVAARQPRRCPPENRRHPRRGAREAVRTRAKRSTIWPNPRRCSASATRSRAANALDRAAAAEARAALQAFARDAEARLRRREAIDSEKKSWARPQGALADRRTRKSKTG